MYSRKSKRMNNPKTVILKLSQDAKIMSVNAFVCKCMYIMCLDACEEADASKLSKSSI